MTEPKVIAGDATLVAVPSGQLVTLQDVIWNEPGPEGLVARFRFVAPAIARDGGTVDLVTASADMLDLCQNYALPRIADFGPKPTQVIISMSDSFVDFGDAAPEATQFFEAYAIEGNVCISEQY